MNRIHIILLPVICINFLLLMTHDNPQGVANQQPNSDTSYLANTSDLKSNRIPDSVFQMRDLKHLGISGMDCDYGDHTTCWTIIEIPAAISNLKNLEDLSLTVNNIITLPKELGALKKLKILDLTDNPGLSNVDCITSLVNLEELSLFGCDLEKLPANIGVLKKLRYLGLAGNPIPDHEIERIRKKLPNCRIVADP